MFKKEEIEFMKIYISLLYKYGYCYFDVRKEYLDEYLKQLENLVEYKKCFKKYNNLEKIRFPETTMIGALAKYVSTENDKFQPMNANFGIVPELDERIKDKKIKYGKFADRGINDLKKMNPHTSKI